MKRKIYLYDSYEDEVREFIPIDPDAVDIYYCGPTVYNYVHIGNFRPTIVFDLLSRVLKECGYEVRCVSNYTDIDDKIIKEAKIEKRSEKELTDFYIRSYEECLEKLNVAPLYAHPRASQYIDEMASFIKKLMDTGHAYRAGDDIYFSVPSVADYGKLSNQRLEDLEAGKRIEVSDDKRDPLDFALWKLTDDDGIKFDTVIGRGRPGWHTECVVMVNSVFHRPLIDIHGGGFDLKFPHHENEIAQSEALNSTKLANYWMHVGFLLTDGVKMSKSLGNSTIARDVLSRYSGETVRLFFLSTHYRAPINFSDEALRQAEKQVDRYLSALKKGTYRLELEDLRPDGTVEEDYEGFMDALTHDLNVANALPIIDREMREINTLVTHNQIGDRLQLLVSTFKRLLSILGFRCDIPALTSEDKEIFHLYEKARAERDYEHSDSYRSRLIEIGIL